MSTLSASPHTPWNKGKLIEQKLSLKLQEIWAIRIRLQLANKIRDLALFNLTIDSKLRGCDLVSLKVSNILEAFFSRASVCSPKRLKYLIHLPAKTELPHDNYLTNARQAHHRSMRELPLLRLSSSPSLQVAYHYWK